jgi:hypothetical protein
MSLPLQWVDRIFDKLTLTYGQAFLSRWRDIDLNAVKSDWAHELAVFERAPNAIAFALSNLSEKPPSVADFKALCRQAPATEVVALSEPAADPERMRAEISKLAALKTTTVRQGNRDWAHRILDRQKSGQKISPTVVQMAKQALGQSA